MKKVMILCFTICMCLSICSCSNLSPNVEDKLKTEQGNKAKPIICDTQNAIAENMQVVVQQAFGTSKPEVEDDKDAIPFVITLAYTGKEGTSYLLGDASSETNNYLRFRILYKNEYYFEEYRISCGKDNSQYSTLLSKAYIVKSGEVLDDLPFLHFEPMDKTTKLQLWMIVPQEVMNSDESTYFVVNVGEQEFWFDITDDDLNWYKKHLKD